MQTENKYDPFAIKDRDYLVNEAKKKSTVYMYWRKSLDIRDRIGKEVGTHCDEYAKAQSLVRTWHARWRVEERRIHVKISDELQRELEMLELITSKWVDTYNDEPKKE